MIDFVFLTSSWRVDDYSIAQLYRRIISPSVKVQNEEWQKQTHLRHRNFKGQSPVSRLKAASPAHSVVSAPGQLEANDMSLQVHNYKAVLSQQHTRQSPDFNFFIEKQRENVTVLGHSY